MKRIYEIEDEKVKRKIAASLLAADFTNLELEIKKIEMSTAEMLHLDVMDGVFVENISFGFPIINALRRITDIFFDVHLMIVNPERYINAFADAGADGITFHCESTENIMQVIEMIRKRNKKVGISINPDTDIKVVTPYLDKVDMVLIMTVYPGKGGQKYIPKTTEKIAEIRRLNKNIDIEVDGGIDASTVGTAYASGANIFVAGTSIFSQPDYKSAILTLKGE